MCNHLQNEFLTPLTQSLTKPADPPTLKANHPCGRLTLTLAFMEAKSILTLALPMIATGLLLYSRSMVSMLFLGSLGSLPLAGGSLAIAFANITGYSVLSGLAMGMEPICGQAFGAGNTPLLRATFFKTVLLLLAASLPISLLWSNMRRILLYCGQDDDISGFAESYILFSLPDLVINSLLHPLRIYLRAQSINTPLTYCAALALLLHVPINYLLVSTLGLGIRAVALASLLTNCNLVLLLLAYVWFYGVYDGGVELDVQDIKGWTSLLNLAVPSCISVCLEWWWYEIMILLCGLLLDPKSTVASMGILIQTTSLIYIFPSSLGLGVSTRVGNELGANRPDRARRVATVGLSCGVVVGVMAMVFASAVRNVWARMFTGDETIVGITASVLPLLGMCELGNCPQTTGCGVLRGSARPRAGVNINLGSFYGVGMPVSVGLAFWVGLDFRGLWLGLLAAQGTCVVCMIAVIRRTDWELQAERAQRLTGGGDIGEGDWDEAGGGAKSGAVSEEDKKDDLVITIKIEQTSSLTSTSLHF